MNRKNLKKCPMCGAGISVQHYPYGDFYECGNIEKRCHFWMEIPNDDIKKISHPMIDRELE